MVPNKDHVTAADVEAALNGSTIIGTTSTNAADYENSGFYQCPTLKSIVIPASVTDIGYRAFFECTALTSVDFSQATSVETISTFAFYQATALESVDFSNANALEYIGWRAFQNTALKSVTLPSSVKTIGRYAFLDVTDLESVNFPSSVKTIGFTAFGNTALTSVSVPVCTEIEFGFVFPVGTNVSKYFSRDCLDNYVVEGITYADILDSFTPEELKAAYRAKGNCPN